MSELLKVLHRTVNQAIAAQSVGGDRERIKQASRELLAGVLAVIAPLDRWTEKEQTQAEVETYILDHVYQTLPEPPYTPDDKAQMAQLVCTGISGSKVRGIRCRKGVDPVADSALF